MPKTEPNFLERVVETFYNVMRQIYVEQVWRQNGQSNDESVVIQRSREDRTSSHPVQHSRTR
jgi:hypothetical protein